MIERERRPSAAAKTLCSALRLFGSAAAVAGLVLTLVGTGAAAQDYPSRPIRIIVPTGAGGITDILARIVGNKMSEQLGQPVVIDNRPGAGGIIGTQAVAQAQPDGYTLLMVFPSHAANPALYAKLPYDSERDFAPITMVTKVSEILLVPPSLPAQSIRELIALAHKTPLNYASVGVGSLAHLSAELFRTSAGIPLTHIPYRGVPQAQTALISGEVSIFFDTPITALPQIKGGTLRALGISTRERLAVAPDIPTIAEAGVAGYEVTGWNGVLAPANTPRAIIDRLNAVIVNALKQPDVSQRLIEQGLESVGNSPEEFARIMHADVEKWIQVAREAGIKPQ